MTQKIDNTIFPVADGPADDAFAVTKSDSVSFTTQARSLWIGGAGDVTVRTPAGSTVTFVGVLAGTLLPVQATRVNATGTTATNIVGLV